MSFTREKTAYGRLLGDDAESATDLPQARPEKKLDIVKAHVSRAYTWILHFLLGVTLTIILLRWQQKISPTCFDSFTDAPLVWEDRTLRTEFARSTGFSNSSFVDSYGRPSPETDAKWDALLGAGIIRLTEEEASRIPTEAVPLYGDEEGYAGFLEVFHQLHCLNRIRKHFYDPAAKLDGDAAQEFTDFHDEHCFDYLRQNLMCYADVSILPIGWNEHSQAYFATFDTQVQKKCRNFDAIYGWAKSRAKKYTPPGNRGQ